MFSAITLMFCRIVIGLVFALSATGKVLDFPAFQASVSNFQILPSGLNKAAAWIFLGAEFTIALLMAIGGSALLSGFVLAASLLVIFSAALVVALRRNTKTTCNCFGRTEQHISPYDVARNTLVVLCSVAGVWALASPHQALYGLEIVLLGLMAACFVVLITNLADVATTLWRPFKIG